MGEQTTKELYDQMEFLWKTFSDNHQKFSEKGVKSAASRARKAIGEIKKMVTEYRKLSVSESN